MINDKYVDPPIRLRYTWFKGTVFTVGVGVAHSMADLLQGLSLSVKTKKESSEKDELPRRGELSLREQERKEQRSQRENSQKPLQDFSNWNPLR